MENLNVTVLIMPQTILDYLTRLAEDTSVDRDCLNDHVLAYFVAQFIAELNSPNMLAFHFSVHMVGATATPIMRTPNHGVEAVTRLRVDLIG